MPIKVIPRRSRDGVKDAGRHRQHGHSENHLKIVRFFLESQFGSKEIRRKAAGLDVGITACKMRRDPGLGET